MGLLLGMERMCVGTVRKRRFVIQVDGQLT
jgi:hypothetical protein